MNRNVLEGKWMQLRGAVREKWGELTDDDLDQINGKRDKLAGILQERYGYSQMEVERDDASATVFTHVLGDGVFYFDNPNVRLEFLFEDQRSKVFEGNVNAGPADVRTSLGNGQSRVSP